MGKEIRILIADINSDLRRLLTICLEREPDMKVVGVTSLGTEALELIGSLGPDVILLDNALLDMDKTDLLEKLAMMEEDVRPAAIILSKYCERAKIEGLIASGLNRPVDLRALTDKVRRAAHLRFSGNPEWAVGTDGEYGLLLSATRILIELGVPTHLSGYFYLRAACIMTALNVNLIGAVTKELYPAVADEFKVAPSQVERCMRTAVECSWNAADSAVIWKYFGTRRTRKPSNSEFISVVADKLFLQRKYIELIG